MAILLSEKVFKNS